MRILEINTWTWLAELRRRYGNNEMKFYSIPNSEWDELSSYGFDAVWFMGVWQRSSKGAQLAQADPGLLRDCAMLGFAKSDIICSPYCIREYSVDGNFGQKNGLAIARQKLRERGMKLILDFVPNHTSLDHPWLVESPNCYVQGGDGDAADKRHFFASGNRVIAYGSADRPEANRRPWDDTAQLNAFSDAYRDAARKTLVDIGDQCDGVRCDMAHLLFTDSFAARWNTRRIGANPSEEFWSAVISRVRERHPEMLFIAESYQMGSDRRLASQGFDYCYDKDPFYDHLRSGSAASLRAHLEGNLDGDPPFLNRLIHFIENHDEESVSKRFSPHERHRMAALIIATIPGASLWYRDQFEERWANHPVQLARAPSYRDLYRKLLKTTNSPIFRNGQWSLCRVTGSDSLLAWQWSTNDRHVLVTVNVSNDTINPWPNVAMNLHGEQLGWQWRMNDLWTDEVVWQGRSGSAVRDGFPVEPKPWWGDMFELIRDS